MTVEEKALELVAENRVILEPGDFPYVAIVAGHHSHYFVEALDTGMVCSCPARSELCAHALAAMVAWQEKEERDRASFARPW